VLELRAEFWCNCAATVEGERLFLFLGMHPVAPDKAPHRTVEIDPLATALPIADIVNQRRPSIIAAYLQDETAIGTGNRFGRHNTRRRALGRTREHILKWEESGVPPLGGSRRPEQMRICSKDWRRKIRWLAPAVALSAKRNSEKSRDRQCRGDLGMAGLNGRSGR
jgi:hypothetical protein